WWDPAGAKVEHQVALVDVKTVLHGDARLKQVKIGFVPNERRRGLHPSAGEEGMYFLRPNPDGGFFALPTYFDRHPRTGEADFAKFDGAARKWLKDNADTYRVHRLVAEKKKD